MAFDNVQMPRACRGLRRSRLSIRPSPASSTPQVMPMLFPFPGLQHPASPVFEGFGADLAAGATAKGTTPALYERLFGYQPERTTLADFVRHPTPASCTHSAIGSVGANSASEDTPASMLVRSEPASPSPLFMQDTSADGSHIQSAEQVRSMVFVQHWQAWLLQSCECLRARS